MDQMWTAPWGPYNTADGTAVTASGALTELTPTSPSQILIPVPALHSFDGKTLGFSAWGVYTTTGTQGTITFDLRAGATGAIGSMTSVAATSALTWVASQTNRIWRAQGSITVRGRGSAGTGVGVLELSNITAGLVDMAATAAGSTFTIDTTSLRTIALGVTLSVASQSITCRDFRVWGIN